MTIQGGGGGIRGGRRGGGHRCREDVCSVGEEKASERSTNRISSGGEGVFHVQGWGPKSAVSPSKPRGNKLFGGIFQGFLLGYPRGAREV